MSDLDQQIIPMLAYEDGAAAMDWLCNVFGFTEKVRWLDDNGRLTHGEISMGKSVIMLASPTADYQSPKHHRKTCEAATKWYEVPYIINGVLVYVDDIDKHFETATENGAVILSPVESGGPGLRYRAEDLEGQRWMFIQK
jgi:PhnB protein